LRTASSSSTRCTSLLAIVHRSLHHRFVNSRSWTSDANMLWLRTNVRIPKMPLRTKF